jgi:hypothetical protein
MADMITQLAQDLEWLGHEAPFYNRNYIGSGPDLSLEKQQEILRTAEKIERELKLAIRYNPNSLVDVDYPLEATLDSIAELLAAIEDIKITALVGNRDLPRKIKQFIHMIESTFGPTGAEAA